MIQRRKPMHHELSPKRQTIRRAWRHPLKRSIKVPHRTAATIAVMETGITDYGVIAGAVGLTVDEVKQIDMAEDGPTRQLGLVGIPEGVYFNLERKVRCPKCDASITIAPCVACGVRERSDRSELDE